jgi:hypothetical protein
MLSAKAGGVGLNLIGGNRLILFDNDWYFLFSLFFSSLLTKCATFTGIPQRIDKQCRECGEMDKERQCSSIGWCPLEPLKVCAQCKSEEAPQTDSKLLSFRENLSTTALKAGAPVAD